MFERIRRFKNRFDALSQEIADAYDLVPEVDGIAEIDSLVAEIRHDKKWIMSKLRIVLDTNVLLSGTGYPNSIYF